MGKGQTAALDIVELECSGPDVADAAALQANAFDRASCFAIPRATSLIA